MKQQSCSTYPVLKGHGKLSLYDSANPWNDTQAWLLYRVKHTVNNNVKDGGWIPIAVLPICGAHNTLTGELRTGYRNGVNFTCLGVNNA